MPQHHIKPVRIATRSSGFTLVEVLVVIAIMSILVTLLIFAAGGAFQNTRIAATRTTIAQINDVIQQRVDAITQMDVSSEAKKLATLNSGVSEAQAEFLIRNALYRQALPQKLSDLQGLSSSDSADDAPLYATWTARGGSTATDSTAVSSALLCLALTEGSRLRVLPNGKSYVVPTLALDSIKANHIQRLAISPALPNQKPLEYFVDEWDQPLRFYTWPTRLVYDGTGLLTDLTYTRNMIVALSSDTSTNGPLLKDPLDPTKTLSTPTLFASGGNLTYAPSSTINIDAIAPTYYRDRNVYHCPLLVSAGPDTTIGMGEPTSSVAAERLGQLVSSQLNATTDNITNQQR